MNSAIKHLAVALAVAAAFWAVAYMEGADDKRLASQFNACVSSGGDFSYRWGEPACDHKHTP